MHVKNAAAIPDFSEMEKQILQEIMNIAFSSASVDLKDVIDVPVTLHVPRIEMLLNHQLYAYFRKNISLSETSIVIEERFWGNFSGTSLLVFPEGINKGLISILSGKNSDEQIDPAIENLEKAVLLEFGNILMGACIGKITELLKTAVTFTPPQATSGEDMDFERIPVDNPDNSSTIIFKTYFRFKNHDLQGNLLVLISHQSIIWLKHVLKPFLEAYK